MEKGYMNEKIREELLKLSEEKYREFSSRLIPGVENILGVRLLCLRKIAKRIAKKDWREYLKNANDTYFEEVMLQGMVIGYVKDSNIEEILVYIKNFIPKINNWSVCDSFCNGLKITNKNKEIVWEFLKKYLSTKIPKNASTVKQTSMFLIMSSFKPKEKGTFCSNV